MTRSPPVTRRAGSRCDPAIESRYASHDSGTPGRTNAIGCWVRAARRGASGLRRSTAAGRSGASARPSAPSRVRSGRDRSRRRRRLAAGQPRLHQPQPQVGQLQRQPPHLILRLVRPRGSTAIESRNPRGETPNAAVVAMRQVVERRRHDARRTPRAGRPTAPRSASRSAFRRSPTAACRAARAAAAA